MPPLPADSIHARACKLKCEKILTRPNGIGLLTYLGCKWHSRGQRFDPAYLHHKETEKLVLTKVKTSFFVFPLQIDISADCRACAIP